MNSSDSSHSVLGTQSSALRLGLFGGTFNPIHEGHLAVARRAREALGLDQILFIPSGDPPHKTDRSLAPAADRCEMVRLAIASDPRCALSDIEIRRPGKSYTIDTIRQLRRDHGAGTQFYFLIGLDAFLDLPTWREPEALLHLCSFVVLSRPGTSFRALASVPLLPTIPAQALADLDAGRLAVYETPIGAQRLICLPVPPSDVSASEIRTCFQEGRSTANLLPPLVESYILKHHLYS